jgi:hypothetical protein
MTTIIQVLKNPRLYILEILKDFSIEQLNKIPEGHNNNIAWNLGHMAATQQTLCYLRSGIPFVLEEDFINTYKSGTKPEKFINEGEFERIKDHLLSPLDQFEQDLKADLFKNLTPFVTRYGVPINNIDDAAAFLPFHEGLHIGYVMSMRKLV